ncbi:MAG TPA: hypothetical protein VMG59_09410 [Phycisphaerae bacterium]|nr:hypothetical protein [Phycisphaerae bacterium]
MKHLLQLSGLGIYTDQFPRADTLAAALKPKSPAEASVKKHSALNGLIPPAGYKPSAELESQISSCDPVAHYAFYAIDQALHAEEFSSKQISFERMALVLLSGWGTMDSTMAYLESMFDADGRYASPLSFTRSINSSLASLAVIHFGIHGPCETLAHDSWPVAGPLERAVDILDCDHADAVIVCWTDQTSPIAMDMCRQAVTKLHRPEFKRFLDGPCGYGSVAMIFGRVESLNTGGVILDPQPTKAPVTRDEPWSMPLDFKPFATDNALCLAAAVMQRILNGNQPAPIYLCETAHHGQKRYLSIL